MSFDPSSIENDLRQLHAAGLDESLLARLEACAEGSWTNLDPLEIHMERRLRGIAPARLPDPLMERWRRPWPPFHFRLPRRRLSVFPAVSRRQGVRSASGGEPPRPQSHCSAVSPAGWFRTIKPASPPPPRLRSRPRNVFHRPSPRLFPAAFNRGLSEASDEGVILHSSNQPHRVLKVVYQRSRYSQGCRRPHLSGRATACGIHPRSRQDRLTENGTDKSAPLIR